MTIYYVRTTGNDANGGTDPVTDAKLTVSAGVALLSGGDILDVGAGTFPETVTSDITAIASGTTFLTPTIIRGAGVGSTTITSSTNSLNLFTSGTGTGGHILFKDLKMTHTATTRGYAISGTGVNSAKNNIYLRNVEVDGCTMAFYSASRAVLVQCENMVVRNCMSDGISTDQFSTSMIDCKFIDNAGAGYYNFPSSTGTTPFFLRCLFSGNGGDGLRYDPIARTNPSIRIYSCTFEGNTGDGVDLSATSGGSISADITDSVFYGNGGDDLKTGTLRDERMLNRNNAFGGSISGWYTGDNQLTLTADPFTDASTEDWSPNNTSGGGALLRYAGSGGADIGAIQHVASGGGGGSVIVIPTPGRIL